MLHEVRRLDIIEAALPQGLQREREPRGMDDVDADAEAGAEPQSGAGVLREIGLVEHELDGHRSIL